MIDIYVLDKNLQVVGVIDSYKSLIWANRYIKIGDCELYLTANSENISLLAIGRYLARSDDDMVCVIKKIEIDTNINEGNYLIVTGYDVKSFLDQRIIWQTERCSNYNLEDFMRRIITNNLISPYYSYTEREFLKENGEQLILLGNKANFTEIITEQVTYKNIGEKIREYCNANQWGYRFVLQDEALRFELYSGTDRSSSVLFSNQYENLASTKYKNDKTHLGNIALVGGAGEGNERIIWEHGSASGVDRFELFVDAKDLSQTTTWKNLTQVYPTTSQGGYGYISGSAKPYLYIMTQIDIQIIDESQLLWLMSVYQGGTIITIDGNRYYRVYNAPISELDTNTPTDETTVKMYEIIYSIYLLNRGVQAVTEYGQKVSFEGSVIPNVTFVYKQDYFLGDVVSVENEYGISANARIIEVVEVLDDKGYSVEPKFEYISTI